MARTVFGWACVASALPEILDGVCLVSGFVFFNGFSFLYDVDVFGQLGKAAWGEAGGEEAKAEERKGNTHC